MTAAGDTLVTIEGGIGDATGGRARMTPIVPSEVLSSDAGGK